MTVSLTEDFKEAMSAWTSGISVVTTNHGGLLYGLTVSSFASVSLEPPLVSVCLGNDNRLWEMIDASGKFAVSILASDQAEASNYFAISGREPTTDFVKIAGEWLTTGMPVIKHALAWVSCEVHEMVAAGDHTLVLGLVHEAHAREDADPLLYYRRGYRTLAPKD